MKENVDPPALAASVIQRRAELGITTQRELAERAGLSPRMVGEIENARRESYRDSTLYKIDQALAWKYGSAKAVLEGGSSYPLEAHVDDEDLDPEDDFDDEDIEDVTVGDSEVDITVYEKSIDLTIMIPRESGDRDRLTVSGLMDAGHEARTFFLERINELRERPSVVKGMSDEEMLRWAQAIVKKLAPQTSGEPDSPVADVPAIPTASSLDSGVSYDDIARQKLAEAQQADYMPAASPHEQPDPHEGVGEEEGER